MRHLDWGGGVAVKSALFLGAHCDDIEIGCGGTIQRIIAAHPQINLGWVTFSSTPTRAAETRSAANRIIGNTVNADIRIETFRNSFFPYDGAEIKAYFERLKREIDPDIIFTHYRHDLHQDHRIISELTWNTFRDHLILEYEIPKFDGDMGVPNSFSPLTRDQLDTKVNVLLECYESQLEKPWFSRDTFEAIARLRGVECNAEQGYAEAFYLRKACLRF